MFPKFIIVGIPGTGMGALRMGVVPNHRDLLDGCERAYGGGWYEIDRGNRTLNLYGSSGDFGEPQFNHLCRIPSEFRGWTLTYATDIGAKSREIDLTDAEWF